ncbi:hypothetical protein HanRHA438_Chr07g0298071 [Helianthus annuus]|nr:hypothetical protein HanRHA438_Chr07g0298071 [Helianthus annuus]
MSTQTTNQPKTWYFCIVSVSCFEELPPLQLNVAFIFSSIPLLLTSSAHSPPAPAWLISCMTEHIINKHGI